MPVFIRSLIVRLAGGLAAGFIAAGAVADGAGKVLINEILVAVDRSGSGPPLLDEDGHSPDWIELYNPGPGAVRLGGHYLSDNPADLAGWRLPDSTVLEPGSYLLVFASGKDRGRPGSELHTNFSLSPAGEFLALTGPDGVIVDQLITGFVPEYPPQRAGVSYGRADSGFHFFEYDPERPDTTGPTPGARNNAGYIGFAAPPVFSRQRGFYDEGFELRIETSVPGATIRYTTNGKTPDASNGIEYQGPIRIDRTQPVRAAVYKDGWKPSGVATHTYIFVDDVVRQDEHTVRTTYDFPETWGRVTPDYGLNPLVVGRYPSISDDLRSVPSVSLVVDLSDLFDAGHGIYTNAERRGAEWERAASVEIIDPAHPDGTRNVQADSGIRIQGGAFRRFNLTHKNSFRLLFKRRYGEPKLAFDLFPEAPLAAQEFDTIVLRMESNDGYAWENVHTVQYARDEFARRTALDLGIPAGHGRFVHVYINGVYWGLYNLVERPDAGFARSYFGAVKEEWDGLNSQLPINEAILDPWTDMLARVAEVSGKASERERTAALLRAQGLDADGNNDPGTPDYIDVDNYIDYMLVNWYLDNQDWPKKNNYTGRQRDARDPPEYRSTAGRESDGFRFFMWDAEASLELSDIIDNTKYRDEGVAEPHKHLRESEEYRVRLGDRAHRALFGGGALTPGRCVERYRRVTRRHASILVPELARWGDQHGDDHSIEAWQKERDRILKNWCQWRTEEFLGSLRTSEPALYPALDAPEFDVPAGNVPPGARIRMTVPETATDVYYTLARGAGPHSGWHHPHDPRLQGGGINPMARHFRITDTVLPVTFLKSGDVWKYLDDGSDQGTAWRDVGFDDSAWPSGPSQLGYGEGDEATVVGHIDVNPDRPGTQRNATTYFRKVTEIEAPERFSFFELEIVYDDAFVVYVNGEEVARQPSLPQDPPFNFYTRYRISRENAVRTFRIPAFSFQPGENTIAVEIHQVFSGSSDISFDLRLAGRTLPTFEIPEAVTGPVWLKARSYDRDNRAWSALNTSFYSVGAVPASADNLVISRIGFDPVARTRGGPVDDRSRFEYIEVMNIDPENPVDMTGVAFVAGIRFEFADHSFIDPGGRRLIVNDRAAFEGRMGEGMNQVSFALNRWGGPEFIGNLNDEGERIALHSLSRGTIHSFEFPGNPGSAAMDGYSLILLNPASAPDHALESNWLLAADRFFPVPL